MDSLIGWVNLLVDTENCFLDINPPDTILSKEVESLTSQTFNDFNIDKPISLIRSNLSIFHENMHLLTDVVIKNNFPMIILQFGDVLTECSSSENIETVNYFEFLGYKISKFDEMFSTHFAIGNGQNFNFENSHYFLAKYFRIISKHRESYNEIQKIKDVEEKFQYLLDYELSIILFYLGDIEEGYRNCDNVVFSKYAEQMLKNSSLVSQQYYTSPLKVKQRIENVFRLPGNLKPSSSSLLKNNNGYLLNLRAVNYSLNENCKGSSFDKDGIIRTRNFLIQLNNKLQLDYGSELIDESKFSYFGANVKGFEDLRLINDKYFLANSQELNKTNTPQIVLGEIKNNKIVKILSLSISDVLECEKNWLPFCVNNELLIIYKSSPFQIYKFDFLEQSLSLFKKIDHFENKSIDFRGSAPPIPYKDGFLFTVHQVAFTKSRIYYHRFVYLSSDFETMKYSKCFYFKKAGIEYNLSICNSDTGLIITHSENDNSSYISIVDYKVVDELFE